jgi:hypothetical protein
MRRAITQYPTEYRIHCRCISIKVAVQFTLACFGGVHFSLIILNSQIIDMRADTTVLFFRAEDPAGRGSSSNE